MLWPCLRAEVGECAAEANADGHGSEDPDWQEAIERGELAKDGGSGCVCHGVCSK